MFLWEEWGSSPEGSFYIKEKGRGGGKEEVFSLSRGDLLLNKQTRAVEASQQRHIKLFIH